MSKVNKILIIQTAFIGDVILATAVVEKLYQYYSEAEIDFLVRKGNESILENHPKLNSVICWDKKGDKYGNLKAITKNIHKSGYDVVVNLQRFSSSGLITVLSGAPIKIGFKKNPLSFLFTHKYPHKIGNGMHEVDRNQKLIESLTDSVSATPKLYPTNSDYEVVQQYKSKKYICLAPASVWFTKQLPLEKWVEIVGKANDDFAVYLLGSSSDVELCDEILKKSKNKNVVNLTAKLSLLQSAALMQNAEMNYVNDSAPLHIASAMNAPVTAFFCSTLPDFGFGPLSVKSAVVEINYQLSCRPCGLHGKKLCPEGHFKCGNDIKL
ncbi:MAG: glycosyltransferase family 9 protein [Flavobacteriales bacterium]|nr:glycosyltransferase family 9 protein [Flavobacteriales bacterium]